MLGIDPSFTTMKMIVTGTPYMNLETMSHRSRYFTPIIQEGASQYSQITQL